MLKRNADLEVTACKAWATEEQYELLRRYLRARHPDGGMVEMDEHDFSDMVEQSPVKTYIVEYREPTVDGVPGRLVGACLTDQQADGLSMIYSFFEPDEARPRRASAPTSSSTISSAPAAPACLMSISAIGSRRPSAWPTNRASARSSGSAPAAGAASIPSSGNCRWAEPAARLCKNTAFQSLAAVTAPDILYFINRGDSPPHFRSRKRSDRHKRGDLNDG